MEKLTLKQITPLKDLEGILRQTSFRGLYNAKGQYIRPYKHAKFSLVKVYPQKGIGLAPQIEIRGKRHLLFTPQPTIYENQSQITKVVDRFLHTHRLSINNLRKAVEYTWEGRGDFHVLPPVIEKHTYELTDGYVHLKKMCKQFEGAYVKDARGNLHHLTNRFLNSFYIDDVSKIDHLDIFNSNAPIINYGLGQNGAFTFHIICDGAHRIDYALEKLKRPITALLVEPNAKKSLYPYYAFPVPTCPTIRLSSKKSEKIYHRLERDKIHLLNDFIKKTLHYDWEKGGLKVGKLRSNVEIY